MGHPDWDTQPEIFQKNFARFAQLVRNWLVPNGLRAIVKTRTAHFPGMITSQFVLPDMIRGLPSMAPDPLPNKLVDHFFRHQSGKLVASLVRFFGLQHFDLVEDMVQSALVEALDVWKIHGVPDQPAAWIHRVAKNRMLDALRRNMKFRNKAAEFALEDVGSEELQIDDLFDESQLQDSQLRMIFACCHPTLKPEDAVPLTLKSLCGFNEEEIAQGMLLEPETVRKRIYRTKRLLIERQVSLDLPTARQLPARLHYVHNVLYLMFNEGYLSTNNDQAIRSDVCEEAARLCHLLTEHPHCSTRNTFALLALMLFHASRFDARIDAQGGLVLLEDQDRQKWDQRMMSRAMDYLNQASVEGATSVYHYEAAIAMQHCRAKTFAETDWTSIIYFYDRLVESADSPVYQLNRAIAIGQRDGPTAALLLLNNIAHELSLAKSPLLDATFGELYRMQGDADLAIDFFLKALKKTQSSHDRELMKRRIAQCKGSAS